MKVSVYLKLLVLLLSFCSYSSINAKSNLIVHNYVDLGLPSGTLWAETNLGANSPEKTGDYLAWAEIKSKDVYLWETYKYGNSYNKRTKYNTKSTLGEVDNLTTLLPEDDAVYVKWGEKWKIPAIEDWIELSDNCYKLWTNNYKNTEVAGLIFFKCKNESERGVFSTVKDTTRSEYNEMYDIHIFLPAAGYKFDDYVTDMGNYGDYWSASLVKDSPGDAWIIYFSAHGVYSREINRKFGHTVRPVRSK